MTDQCPSCSVPYINHLGLIGTCAKLLKAEKELQKLRQALQEIASTSPVSRPLANGEEERCIMCRCLIDRAREALGQQPWPAPSQTSKSSTNK